MSTLESKVIARIEKLGHHVISHKSQQGIIHVKTSQEKINGKKMSRTFRLKGSSLQEKLPTIGWFTFNENK